LFRFDGDIAERKQALDETVKQNEHLLKLLAEGKKNDRDVILAEFGGMKPGFDEGSSLSYQDARIFDEISEKKNNRWDDPSDLKHALSASASDLFVTHDDDFAFWIARIPNIQIEVLNHVHLLIERI
jgi:hypothetical protein